MKPRLSVPSTAFATLAGIALLCLLSGCTSLGPSHLYIASAAQPYVVQDCGPGSAARIDIPSFIAPGEGLTGLAYDPSTDELVLRLAPGNRIRVVDRPRRQIKREFVIPELPETGGGDLAVRPSDGNIFFVHPTATALVETNRLGEFIRQFSLVGVEGKVAGVAYKPAENQLLVLDNARYPRLGTFDLAGHLLHSVPLDYEGARGHLGYDSGSGEIYVAAVWEHLIQVFNAEGVTLRWTPTPRETTGDFIDVGPRFPRRAF